MTPRAPFAISGAQARRIWLAAQKLDQRAPFGAGPEAVRAAVAHLGYVQIDTIHVVERCHHHILFSRIPDYRRSDLRQAQSLDKSVFECWAHALAYAPTADYRFFLRAMQRDWRKRAWMGPATEAELRAMAARIERDGPLTIRDIDDAELVEKDHAWASRKPSKRVLQLGFHRGLFTISAREGMLKTYELTARHFGWAEPPRAATPAEIAAYKLDRALRAQGVVSLDSICHLDAPSKEIVRRRIEARVRRGLLAPVALEGAGRQEHWAAPEALERAAAEPGEEGPLIHILSPFDPLIIQRKRLKLFFGYEHRFEAYVPKEKRVMGYFALPVLAGDRIVAAVDLKADRAAGRLLIRQWTWTEGEPPAALKAAIDEELDRFERFQLG